MQALKLKLLYTFGSKQINSLINKGKTMTAYDTKTSKAFMSEFKLPPYQSGTLDGLTFAVKDIIDIKDHLTGGGNPDWAKTHPKAIEHAICVDQLLAEGAECIGKTISDELAFSLIGENHFYGTPLNPKTPDRVPGGSSSGSASAVACGIVDFALGTDTGGSVRVPASNCGLWGFRPSHDRISLAGVMPLAPSFDTVAVLAKDAETLSRASIVLLGSALSEACKTNTLFLLDDIFKICDQSVQYAMAVVIEKLGSQYHIQNTDLTTITEHPIDYKWLHSMYCQLQWPELWSTAGPWINEVKPKFGHTITESIELSKNVSRQEVQKNIMKREFFTRKIHDYLSNDKIICFPTVHTPAPKLGAIAKEKNARSSGIYFPKALGINAIAGLARLPQITMPLAEVNSVPIGLSIAAARGNDELLFSVIDKLK